MEEQTTATIDLGHPFAIILTLVPALINFGLFSFAAFYLPKNRLNITFTLFVLMLGFWQLAEGFMHMSASAETALQWYRVSSVPSLGVCVLQIVLALLLTGWDEKIPPIVYYVVLGIPGLLLLMLLTDQLDHYRISSSALWHWVASPQLSFYTDVFYISLSVYSVGALGIFTVYFIKSRKLNIKRQQALLLLIGCSAPVIGGIIGEVLLPLVFHVDSMPVTTPLITVYSVTALIAIRRYGLLDYSPLHQLERVLKTMNEGIVIVDNSQQIVYTNEQFSHLAQYSADELRGHTLTSFAADDASKATLRHVYEQRRQNISGRYQLQVIRKDGMPIWLNVSGFPYLDKGGNIIGSVGMTTDITELMNTQLELKKKINDLNIFFYKTAHDFKTPIASMQGLLDVYSKDDNVDELLHYMKLCVKNLQQIVSRVSQLSVIQQKQVVTAELDVEEILNKTIRELETENGKTAKIDLQLEETTVVSELFLLTSILKNLIDNAMKYTHPGRETLITVSLSEKTDMYEWVVKDNGAGISPDIQKKIFDMFYRGNDKSKGAGLGLYIVKSAVEKLHGSISVKSEAGIGAEFTLLLPVAEPGFSE